MTRSQMEAIYKRDYWDKIKGDDLPFAVAFEVFDAAVNHGVGQAVRMLQKACGVSADGIIGPITLSTAQAMGGNRFKCRFNAERLQFYTDLPTFPAFGKGWVRRVANNLRTD